MWRCVRAFDEAEFAVVAEVNEFPYLVLRKFVGVGVDFVFIEALEEFWKSGTEIGTQPARIADVVLPP
jgi:hypothetical protein